jgi:hypothetical protein
LAGRRVHADGLQVVEHPGFVRGFFMHVLVHEVADGLQRLLRRVAHAAGRRGAHGVEVPHHVVQLQEQRAVTLNGHALGHGIQQHGVVFEGTAVLVGGRYQIRKKRQHRKSQRSSPGYRVGFM